MNQKYRENYTIRSYDANFLGELKLNNLLQYLQEIAGNHAHELNLGYHHLIDRDMTWLLSRMHVKIDSMPVWRDDISISTWAKGQKKLYAIRDFTIAQGGASRADLPPLIAATSAWILWDIKNKKPIIPTTELAGIEFCEEPAISQFPAKLSAPTKGKGDLKTTRQVDFDEIDLLGHVNNTQYIKWILNSYDLDFYRKNRIVEFQINYLQEAKYRDQIEISHLPAELDSVTKGLYSQIISARRADEDVTHFVARIGYVERNRDADIGQP